MTLQIIKEVIQMSGRILAISFVMLIVLLFSLNAFATNIHRDAETDGFRGIKWGTNISTLKDMHYMWLDNNNGGAKVYSRKGDKLVIGGANLESIGYGFWQNKLYCVHIRFNGFNNFLSLKDVTFKKYGVGFKKNEFIEQYYWSGEITFIFLNYNEITKEGYFGMFSKEIQAQVDQADADKAKKGAEKDF